MNLEQEARMMDFEYAMEAAQHHVYEVKAQYCPVCRRNCGEAGWDAGDESVGIYPVWGNTCPVHGDFYTWPGVGTQELDGDT